MKVYEDLSRNKRIMNQRTKEAAEACDRLQSKLMPGEIEM
jgi:hypothetical protein